MGAMAEKEEARLQWLELAFCFIVILVEVLLRGRVGWVAVKQLTFSG